MEWSDDNKFCAFNSWKGLLYSPWYQSIKDWKDGKRDAPLPPVEASLDPIHACNLMCEHCNAHKYLVGDEKIKRITDEHLLNLVKFLGEWGVKAICFGGGGEPTLHTKLSEALLLTREMGMDVSVVSNGIALDDKLIDTIARTCRWVGISVDAGCADTYKQGKKKDYYGTVLHNITKLVKKVKELKTNCDIAFKFLVMPYNQTEIYGACLTAKALGVKDFHARPADFRHQGMGELKKKENEYNIDWIKKQFEKCHDIATKDFRVFTIMHKFSESFIPKKKFAQCYSTPCCIQLCADGLIYLCPDQRHSREYILGKHYPNPENIENFWGSKEHYALVFEKGAKMCTTRCTFGPYSEQIEKLFINNTDPMCWKFI